MTLSETTQPAAVTAAPTTAPLVLTVAVAVAWTPPALGALIVTVGAV